MWYGRCAALLAPNVLYLSFWCIISFLDQTSAALTDRQVHNSRIGCKLCGPRSLLTRKMLRAYSPQPIWLGTEGHTDAAKSDHTMPRAWPIEPFSCRLQVALIVERGPRHGLPLQYPAARAALWVLHNFPALVEAHLFPNNVRMPVCDSCRDA